MDEAFLAYTYAEKAALQIQINFRSKKLRQQLEKDVDTDTDDHSDDKLKGGTEDKEDDEEGSRMWTLLFLACGAAFMMLGHCFSCAGKLFGGNSDVDAPVPIEGAAPPPGQGGGGGGAAPPPGLEAMAGNVRLRWVSERLDCIEPRFSLLAHSFISYRPQVRKENCWKLNSYIACAETNRYLFLCSLLQVLLVEPRVLVLQRELQQVRANFCSG